MSSRGLWKTRNSVDPVDSIEATLDSYFKEFVTQITNSVSNYLQTMFGALNETTQDLWTSLVLGGVGWQWASDRNDSSSLQEQILATLYTGAFPLARQLSPVAQEAVLL